MGKDCDLPPLTVNLGQKAVHGKYYLFLLLKRVKNKSQSFRELTAS